MIRRDATLLVSVNEIAKALGWETKEVVPDDLFAEPIDHQQRVERSQELIAIDVQLFLPPEQVRRKGLTTTALQFRYGIPLRG